MKRPSTAQTWAVPIRLTRHRRDHHKPLIGVSRALNIYFACYKTIYPLWHQFKCDSLRDDDSTLTHSLTHYIAGFFVLLLMGFGHLIFERAKSKGVFFRMGRDDLTVISFYILNWKTWASERVAVDGPGRARELETARNGGVFYGNWWKCDYSMRVWLIARNVERRTSSLTDYNVHYPPIPTLMKWL